MAKIRLNKSAIPYVDYSWGVVDGCTKKSEACANCYAEAIANRFWKDRPFSQVMTHPERLLAPINTKKPGRVFVAPMGDLFHEKIPFDFIDQVFAVMALCPQHTFLILTKRPKRMLEYYNSEFREALIEGAMQKILSEIHGRKEWISEESFFFRDLENLWVGTTVENQKRADERISDLLKVSAAIHFISGEPLLGEMDIEQYLYPACPVCGNTDLRRSSLGPDYFACDGDCDCTAYENEEMRPKLNLVIIGCESGPGKRETDIVDVINLIYQCEKAGTKVYVKQLDIDGKIVELPAIDGKIYNQLPEPITNKEF
ncbi:MAG TPA: DUF5131 family protein [Ignavibacteriales bacterium]|nr:DUF5131 family protein [Ignavibacteriales bacterium]